MEKSDKVSSVVFFFVLALWAHSEFGPFLQTPLKKLEIFSGI